MSAKRKPANSIEAKLADHNIPQLADQLGKLSRTALGVVYSRATYGHLLRNNLNDPLGKKIIAALEYEPKEGNTRRFSAIGPLRTQILDGMVSDFISANPEGALVVNLGCGLCTRYERLESTGRLDPRKDGWVSIDMPPMVGLRNALWKVLSPDTARWQENIAGSVFESDWIAPVKRKPQGRILIMAEGVLGYYEPDVVKSFFHMLQANFSGATVLVTIIHPLREEMQKTESPTREKHKWFVETGKEIETMAPGMRVVREEPFNRRELLDPKKVEPETLVEIDRLPRNVTSGVMLRIG